MIVNRSASKLRRSAKTIAAHPQAWEKRLEMLFRLHARLRKPWFNHRCREITATPPVVCEPESPVVFLTQTFHADVVMFLLAAKSLAQHLRPRAFVVVDDGLTGEDLALLTYHLSNVRFVQLSEVQLGPCPSGGTWERLLTIMDIVGDSYVIQLDADTLTLRQPTEVLDAVSKNRSFTIGTDLGQSITSFKESAAVAERHRRQDHMVIRAERAFSRYPGGEQLKYVRGCSGFAGFARGQFKRSDAETFSTNMADLIGASHWRSWGSEQVTSNFLIANAPDALVLPLERYATFEGRSSIVNDAAFVHFLGTYRFKRGLYGRLARRLIRRLKKA
ncbi:MAG: hypothetical protein H6729_08655 [Deltaproteobacteria bacterium]|nr:hypothetical protein [Deltaproteobacteria bacterium]